METFGLLRPFIAPLLGQLKPSGTTWSGDEPSPPGNFHEDHSINWRKVWPWVIRRYDDEDDPYDR